MKYTDQTIENCLGEYGKIFRTWTIIDCVSNDIKTCEQWILTKDLLGPSILPLADTVISVQPWTCEGLIQLDIKAEPNCSPIAEVVWSASSGVISDGNVLSDIWLNDSPIEVRVAVIDRCDQITRDTFLLTIIDAVAPVAISVDTLNVSLTGINSDHIYIDQGVAKVMAEAFDKGSYDSGCGKVSTCVLLQSELDAPVIRNDKHLRNESGLLMYTPQQCVPHGIYEYKYISNKDTLIEMIEYVSCAPFVKFCCSDIGSQKVALVVADTSSHSSDAIAWSIVNIEDKSAPIVHCKDIELRCGSDYSVIALGEPEWYNTFCGDSEIYNVDQGAIDQCGEGTIERRWYVDNLYACSQYIHMSSDVRFDPYSIKWPKHYDGTPYGGVRRECEETGLDRDGEKVYAIKEYPKTLDMGDALECEGDILMIPTWCNTDCGLIALTHEDIEVKASDACKKIIRRWTIIDWCTYSPNESISDNGGNEFQAVDDTWLGEGWWNPNVVNGEACTTCDHPSASSDPIYFRYSEVEMDGYYVFDQIIKIVDTTPPSITVAQEITVNILDGATSKTDAFDNCVGSTDVIATVSDFCGTNSLDINNAQWWIELKNSSDEIVESYSINGDSVAVRTPNGSANDVYYIHWQVTDLCGNSATEISKIEYADTKAPTPICIQSISTAAMSTDGSVQIWAVDFDGGSFDNCSEVELLFLDTETDSFAPSLTLTCMDLDNGMSSIIELNVYVRDMAGNIDFCTVELDINDERDICPDVASEEMATISGQVYTELGVMIEDVEVSLNNAKMLKTSVDGVYAFEANPMYQSYDITAYKGDRPLNGVTSLDLVLIQKHVLGIQGLLTPYQLIAADINGDQKVTAADLVELRRLILGIQTDFSNNDSWRFVSAQNAPSEMEFIWPFTEAIFINSLEINRMAEDFVGVKIGDVSGNVIANSIQTRSNSTGRITLHAPSVIDYSAGFIEIPIYAKSIASMTALQFTIEHDFGDLVTIVPGRISISDEQFAILNEGVSTVVWHDVSGVDLSEDTRLFSLRFKMSSNESFELDRFSINSELTEAKIYDNDGREYTINWEWTSMQANEVVFELFQNEPNPFLNNSTIRFTLPRTGEATLTFFDVTGRVLDVVVDHYTQGLHEVLIEKNQFGYSGVIYYQLESGDNTAIRKMIILD